MWDCKTVTVVDPRSHDGTPYGVAERAVSQIEALTAILAELLPATELMARNAEMTRRLDLGFAPAGDDWAETPQGRQWTAIRHEVDVLQRRLRVLKGASAYDPRHPTKE